MGEIGVSERRRHSLPTLAPVSIRLRLAHTWLVRGWKFSGRTRWDKSFRFWPGNASGRGLGGTGRGPVGIGRFSAGRSGRAGASERGLLKFLAHDLSLKELFLFTQARPRSDGLVEVSLSAVRYCMLGNHLPKVWETHFCCPICVCYVVW